MADVITGAGAPSAAKMCVSCGRDCSKTARSKDAQGRYTCKACIDKMQAATRSAAGPGSVVVKPAAVALPQELVERVAKPASNPGARPPAKAPAKGAPSKSAPPAESSSESDFMALFGKEAPKLGAPCEQCGDAMPPNGRICVRCGFDRESGRRMRTRVQAAPVDRGPSKLGSAAGSVGSAGSNVARLLAEPAVFSALAFGGLLLLYFAAMQDKNLVVFYFAGLSLYGLVAWVSMIVTAFLDGNKGWGVLGIISPFLPLAIFPVLYYLMMVAERRWLTMMWIGQVVLTLMSWGLIAQHLPGR